MAARIYKLASGVRVPSVTSILARWKDPGGLLHWANTIGLEGKTLQEAREEATTPGTIVHDWIDQHLGGASFEEIQDTNPLDGKHPSKSPHWPKIAAAFHAFERWQAQSGVEIREREVERVSEHYQFGGCIDGLGYVDGKRALIDWKTSNGVYVEYLLQVGAYTVLENEYAGDTLAVLRDPAKKPRERATIEEIHLCRFAKDDASFHHHSWSGETLTLASQAFLSLLNTDRIAQILKKRL
jgi:hypothetical protein